MTRLKEARCFNLSKGKIIPTPNLGLASLGRKSSGDFHFQSFPKGITLRQPWGGGEEAEIEMSDKGTGNNKISSPHLTDPWAHSIWVLRSGGGVQGLSSPSDPKVTSVPRACRASPSRSHRTNPHSHLAVGWDEGISPAMSRCTLKTYHPAAVRIE